MPRLSSDIWDNPYTPCCVCCGRMIQNDPNAPKFFSQVPGLEPKSVRYKELSVTELRRLLAEGKCQWQSAYRAILRSGSNPPFVSGMSYRHSGFGVRGSFGLAVPRQEHTAILVKGIIHPRGQLLWFTKPRTDIADEVQVGWPMHESCWMMVEKFFGRELVDNNIEIFMYSLGQEYIRKRMDCRINRSLGPKLGKYGYLEMNPMRQPELVELAQVALQRSRVTFSSSENELVSRIEGFSISPGSFSKIPLDIAMDIAEYLCGPDLRKMMLAARWKFPDIYWRRRIPKCVIEFHETLAGKEADWQYVGLEYGRFMEQQNGIHHRIRIIHYMARIYGSYHSLLGDCSRGGNFVNYTDFYQCV